jgi:hypothetical protein
MVPIFIVIKSDGTIWQTQSLADAQAVSASPILRVQLTPSVHPGSAVKIATVTGNSGSYGCTDAMAGEFGNRHARSL